MIKIGDSIPSVKLRHLEADGTMGEVDTAALFKGKTAVLFGVPGAFTPTCTNKHIPGFIEQAEALKKKGVQDVYCVAVNDVFVMKAWGNAVKAAGKVSMIADGNGAFIDALGLAWDASVAQLGKRGRRFAMLVKDGKVEKLNAEDTGGLTCSTADDVLKMLG